MCRQWWCKALRQLRWNHEFHGGSFAQESRSKRKREKEWEERKERYEIKEIVPTTLLHHSFDI